MNNKIQELADEAKAYCHETFQNTKSAEWMPYTQMYDKKFAELIVWECCKICDTIGREARKQWKAKYNPHDDGRSDGAWECEEQIKEHFGWRD